jgi:hypothetical protein
MTVLMDYYYKMTNIEEKNLVQQILFLKGYGWVNSKQEMILLNNNDPEWIYICPESKTLYTTGMAQGFRSMDLNELLDLIESDEI